MNHSQKKVLVHAIHFDEFRFVIKLGWHNANPFHNIEEIRRREGVQRRGVRIIAGVLDVGHACKLAHLELLTEFQVRQTCDCIMTQKKTILNEIEPENKFG